MISETDVYYYIALAIVFVLMLYVIYISLRVQNNVIEGFLGSDNKKDNKNKTEVEKGIENLININSRMEDALKVRDNKSYYSDMLDEYQKRMNYYILIMMVSLSSGNKEVRDSDIIQLSGMIAGLKHFDDGIEKMHDFIKSV
jgi:hypothetical protein